MKEIEKRNRSAVELTGVLRKNALDASAQGMPIAGGRIRIGGTPMNQDPTKVDPGRDPLNNIPVMDVEAVRPIDGVCKK
jgi:hypothetical protein